MGGNKMDAIRYIFLILSVCLFGSCSHKIVDTSNEINNESSLSYNVKIDTIKQIDSIYIKEFRETLLQGDTIINNNYIYEYRYKNLDHSSVDTVIKIDTIYHERTVNKEIIKEVHKLYWWQTALIYLGIFSILFFVAYIVGKNVKI